MRTLAALADRHVFPSASGKLAFERPLRASLVGRLPGRRFDGRTSADGDQRRFQDRRSEMAKVSRHARNCHVHAGTQQSHGARQLGRHGTNELALTASISLLVLLLLLLLLSTHIALPPVPCVSPNTRYFSPIRLHAVSSFFRAISTCHQTPSIHELTLRRPKAILTYYFLCMHCGCDLLQCFVDRQTPAVDCYIDYALRLNKLQQ